MFKTIFAICLGFVATGVANADTVHRKDVEQFDSWQVAKLPESYQYMAYTRIDDYWLGLVASRDLVGPGCQLNKAILFSDMMKNPVGDHDQMAYFVLGEKSPKKDAFAGKIMFNTNGFAPYYGVTTATTEQISKAVESSYDSRSKTVSVIVYQPDINKTVSLSGSAIGMKSAFQRALDRCRLDAPAGKDYIPVAGVK